MRLAKKTLDNGLIAPFSSVFSFRLYKLLRNLFGEFHIPFLYKAFFAHKLAYQQINNGR